MSLVLEFTVEPFVSGAPGPHVESALAEVRARGLDVDFGPLGTRASGDDDQVLAATDGVVRAAIAAGANRVSVQVSRPE